MAKVSFSELINQSEVPVLVDFYATWCGPCKALAPVLSDVAAKLNNRLKVIKIDVDQNQAASQAYRVQGVPTLILFYKGKQLWRQSGAMSAAQLTQAIEQKLPKV